MLCKLMEERPTIEECLQSIKGFDHLSDQTGTTNNNCNKNGNKDRTCIDNSFPQAHDEMEIPESVCSDVIDSFSNTEEEFSDCEMNNMDQQVSLSLEMSEQEEEAAAEEESKTK